MGQYYMPTLIDDNGKVSCLYSHDYNNGLKLMEHSWLGNAFVNAVCTQLWKRPQNVAWIGDYSNYYNGDVWEKKMPNIIDYAHLYESVWVHEDYKIRPEVEKIVNEKGFSYNGLSCYIVNHTTNQYINLADYYNENRYFPELLYDKNNTDPWCIHPLPLLTACGNDRGFGDFHDGNRGYELVGTWAFDTIELTDEDNFPDEYEQWHPHFREGN